jgi:small subunit ribosomal protein S7
MRRKQATSRNISPDPIFGNVLVTKLINRAMVDGKKSVSQKQIYNAFDIIENKTGQNPVVVFLAALEVIKPTMEVRSRRVGGAAYQVPAPVRGRRQESLCIRWLVEAARSRSNSEFHTFGEKMAQEIIDASNSEGVAFKKKQDVEKMAEANRAFVHFRW